MDKKTIMVDMDGVITEDCFSDILEDFLNRKIDFEGEKIKWRQDLIIGKEDEFRGKYGNVNLYANSRLKEGCYEVLKKLNEKYDIYVVTQYVWGKEIINSSENLKNKFNFLREKLDFIDPNRFIFLTNKNLMQFDVKIDDSIKNLENCSNKLLFSAVRNMDITEKELDENKITRVYNWKEIEGILLK